MLLFSCKTKNIVTEITAKEIRTILLCENMRSHCVREFHIDSKDKKGNWKTVYKGTTIGEGLRIKLN